MTRLRQALYRLGFRPRLGSIFHSPSLDHAYYCKAAEPPPAVVD